MIRRLRHRFSTLPPADRAAWTALGVAALIAIVVVVAQDPGDGGDAIGADAPGATPAPGAPSAGQPQSRVGQETPLLLGGTHYRVLRASLSGRAVDVTMRVRNRTGRTQRVGANGQGLTLRVARAQVRPRPLPAIRVAEGTSETVRAQFELPADLVREIELERPQQLDGDLIATPWSEPGSQAAIGLIRLRIELPG